MNLPNAITVARVALVPVFLVFAYGDTDSAELTAWAVFLVASLSDSLDGYLARKHGTITRFGQFVDPLADKILVGAALVVLVADEGFPLWAALVIAVRELAVQVLRIRRTTGGRTMPASQFAKAKTATQITMVSWWLLPWDSTNPGHWAWLVAALVTTIASGWEYFARAPAPARVKT
ncbi:MAG TPA: CDP-diacylglycerol--glycerol-3-phosphate 3-phosphatidyltransferase [Actinomycetota bacterium]|nr:CDP-diacylglycerol--glycerol-3-phosphate 3-phosphatidyltransferase [Actinomycetota bacterium]